MCTTIIPWATRAQGERRTERAEEDERAQEDLERERKEKDPAYQREKWSESLCDGVWRKKCALAAIAAEKKLAKRAGVVNLRLLQDQKEILKDAENDIREAQRELKAMKMKPLACKPAECEQRFPAGPVGPSGNCDQKPVTGDAKTA